MINLKIKILILTMGFKSYANIYFKKYVFLLYIFKKFYFLIKIFFAIFIKFNFQKFSLKFLNK